EQYRINIDLNSFINQHYQENILHKAAQYTYVYNYLKEKFPNLMDKQDINGNTLENLYNQFVSGKNLWAANLSGIKSGRTGPYTMPSKNNNSYTIPCDSHNDSKTTLDQSKKNADDFRKNGADFRAALDYIHTELLNNPGRY
ncbi:MAG: hypothetical protein AAF195_04630, partial [Pseudomonadota bacterium]